MGTTEADADPRAPSLLMLAYLADKADLVRAFAPRLGSRDAAEDLIQELGCKIAEQGDRAAPERPSAYLYRLAFNLMLDLRRRERRARGRDGAWRREHVVTLAGEPVNDEVSAERALDAKVELGRILDGLSSLPPKTRRAFELHKLAGHSHSETAALMGISRSGVEKHMMAALRILLAKAK